MTPVDHPPVVTGRIGVLLVNLGTPDNTDYWSIRRYLSEFLSDRRVVEIPPLAWQPILQGIILTVRPKKTGRAYAKIWDHARGLSPLAANTLDQAEALRTRIGSDSVQVDWAMRYGNPSIASRLADLKARGCQRILLAPLYPQYSGATTATVVDAAGRALAAMRWQPALRTLPPYFEHPAYISALATSVRAQIAALEQPPDVLLASFHGMPQRTLDLGDPYHCHCQKTARLLREALDWPQDRFRVSFQSRFGPAQWLRPYTESVLQDVAREGVKSLAVVSPAFAVDCLETLEEMAIAGRETFLAAGGARFSYLKCLNASPEGMDMIEALVRQELSGWL